MSPSRKLSQLRGFAIDVHSAIETVLTVLANEESTVAFQAVGPLNLAAEKLQTVIDDLDRLGTELMQPTAA